MDENAFVAPLISKLDGMLVGVIKTLPLLAIAILVLILTAAAAAMVRRLLASVLDSSHVRPSLRDLFLTLAKVATWILGFLVATTVVFPSLTPAKLLAALGLGSIAVGLAFKDIFENFLAGAMIMLRKPMRIGDFIECESVEGKVEQITIRDTYVRRTDDQLVLVPNSYLFKNPVFVRTDKTLRRFEVVCGVAYGEDADQAREVIREAVESIGELVEHGKPVEVYAREFNASSIDFTVRWWARSKPIDMHRTRDQVVRGIKRALDEAGIEIPFPYRTLTFKEPVALQSATTEGGPD